MVLFIIYWWEQQSSSLSQHALSLCLSLGGVNHLKKCQNEKTGR